jgi:hypothetical protein
MTVLAILFRMAGRCTAVAVLVAIGVATACSKGPVADGEECDSEADCFPRSACVTRSGWFSSYSVCEPCPVAKKDEIACPPKLHIAIEPADQDVAVGTVRFRGVVRGAIDEIDSVTWTFGDGQSSHGVATEVDHAFAAFGRYDIKAVVATRNGEQGEGRATIRVCREACAPNACNAAGWCDPPLLAKGELHPFALAGADVLVTGHNGAFYRCARAGCDGETALVGIAQDFDIAAAGARVAWISEIGRVFSCVLPACSTPEQIIAQPINGSLHGLATDGARVWFFHRTHEDVLEGVFTLVSCAVDTPCTTPAVHATTTRAGRLWIDGDFVFSHRGDAIERVHRDASGEEPLETVVVVPPGNGAVYTHLPGSILHRALRGGHPVLVRCPAGHCDLATAPIVLEADVATVAASATRIFYTDGAKVRAAALDGGGAPAVIFEATQPLWGGLVADGNGVFVHVNGGFARVE